MPLQIVEEIHIDVRTSDLTLTQVLREVERIQAEHPDNEIFLDGDAHAIVARRRMIA